MVRYGFGYAFTDGTRPLLFERAELFDTFLQPTTGLPSPSESAAVTSQDQQEDRTERLITEGHVESGKKADERSSSFRERMERAAF